MKVVCVLVLFAFFSAVLCNCGCIKCNPNLRVCHSGSSPIKFIYRDSNYCDCPKKVPYSVQVPEVASDPALRYLRYHVEEPKLIVRPEASCVSKTLDLQVQVPVAPVEPVIRYFNPSVPFYYGGLVARPDRVVLQRSTPCDLPREVPVLHQYAEPVGCGCRNRCNCGYSPCGCRSRCNCGRYVEKSTPNRFFPDFLFGQTFTSAMQHIERPGVEEIIVSSLCKPKFKILEERHNLFEDSDSDNRPKILLLLENGLGRTVPKPQTFENILHRGVSKLNGTRYSEASVNTISKTATKEKLPELEPRSNAPGNIVPKDCDTIHVSASATTHDKSGTYCFFKTCYSLTFQKPTLETSKRRSKRSINWDVFSRKSGNKKTQNLPERDIHSNKILRQNKPKLHNILEKLSERRMPLVGQKHNRLGKNRQEREPEIKRNEPKSPFWRVDDLAPSEVHASFSKPAERSRKWDDAQLKNAPKWWQKERWDERPRPVERWWHNDDARGRRKRSLKIEDETMLPFYDIDDDEEEDDDDFKPRLPKKSHKDKQQNADTPLLNLLGAPLNLFSQFSQLTKQAGPNSKFPQVLGTSKRFFTELLTTFGKDAMNLGTNLLFSKRSNALPRRRIRRSASNSDLKNLLSILEQISKSQGNDVLKQSLSQISDTRKKRSVPLEALGPHFEDYGYPVYGYSAPYATNELSEEELQEIFRQIPDTYTYKEDESPNEDLIKAINAHQLKNAGKSDDIIETERLLDDVVVKASSSGFKDGPESQNYDTYYNDDEYLHFNYDDPYLEETRTIHVPYKMKRATNTQAYTRIEENDVGRFLQDQETPESFLNGDGRLDKEEFLNGDNGELSDLNKEPIYGTYRRKREVEPAAQTLGDAFGSIFSMFLHLDAFQNNATRSNDILGSDHNATTINVTESQNSSTSKPDEEEIGQMLEETKQMFRVWEVKAKNVQIQSIRDTIEHLSFDIKTLEDYDTTNDLLILANLTKLQTLKDDFVENSSDKRDLIPTKIKDINVMKDEVMRQIVTKIHDDTTKFQAKFWIKTLIQLQKLHCTVNKISQKLTYGKMEVNLLQVLRNIRLTIGDYTKHHEAHIEKLRNLVKTLKRILVQGDPDTIRNEAAILWELKNVGKLQRETIEELNKKILQGVRKRRELKILFDLQKQFEEAEDKQRRLIETLNQ